MAFVNITALTFPEGAEAEVERRFANRTRGVDTAPGFVSFQLLRPVFGESRYFVMTTWETREAYEEWKAHRAAADHTADHANDSRRGMSIELLGFDVVESAD